jgi:isopenicillin N synthase-like dioxygenase
MPDEDFFVKLHSYEGHDETWLRYMEYYDEYTEEEKKVTGGLWLTGHQDFTSLSILFSQPMSSLQVRDFDNDSEWRFVPYVPGAIIVNAGETFKWWTGDYFKAAIHRVVQPPEDQRGHNRCSVFYFCVPNDEVVINTLLDESPVLREAGVQRAHEPQNAPTSKAWSNGRIKITGRNAVWDGKTAGENMVVEKVGTVETRWFR